MATPSLKWYVTSQQALIWDENAIQKQWEETPWYNMFNSWNTQGTSTQSTTDLWRLAKDKEVEVGLWVSVASPMSDSQKQQYLDSLTDEQRRQMRAYKNQWYSFEASRTLLENSEWLANPIAQWVDKYQPKGNFFRNVMGWIWDSATWIWQFVGNTAADIIGRTAKKLWADEDRVNYLVDDFKNYLEDSKISKTVKANTNSLWYKWAKIVWDLAQSFAVEWAIKWAIPRATKWLETLRGAWLAWKIAANAIEWAAGMAIYEPIAESRMATPWELAFGWVVWAALPVAWAWLKAGKNLIKREAWSWAEKLIERITKISPSKLQKFADKYWESVGKVMNDRWLKTRQDAYKWFETNIDMLDNAMKTIKWNFKSQEVTDVLKENIKHAKKTLDKKNIDRLLALQEKNAIEWLSMEEIQGVKRYFEANTKFSYKTQWGDKAQRATNLDTALRERQRKIAAENWLENLAQINRETQMAYDILNNSKDIEKGILWKVDVTDELLAIHYGWLDWALATYVTKNVLKSAQFQSKLVDILNRLSWHQTINAVLADLHAIKSANTVKEFEALMKKRELDPALPAPKAWWVNDAWYNILQQWETIIWTPEWTNILKDSITEIRKPAGKLDFSTKWEGFAKLRKDWWNYMIMSVENPMWQQQSAALNKKATEKFRRFLDENWIEWKAQKWMYGNPENSQIIAIDNAQQRSIIDKRAEANNVPQAENIIVKDWYAYRYDPRTYEAYKVDLKKADLNLPAETKDFYSEVDGRKYQLPLYWELEQPISVEEFLSIYSS